MNTPSLPDVSRAEFEILRILWKQGSSSVREVHDQLAHHLQWAYTTTKTMMDRMTQKNLLKRESFHGLYVYSAVITRPQGLARFVQFFADRVLELEAASVLHLFGDSTALSDAELKELEQLLDPPRRKGKK
jgi:BlaI family transcriptional regulator, penicillinase repressor